MFLLKVYSLNESEKWDDIVHSFKKYDVYYLNGYTKAFKLIGDGEPILIFYEDNNIRGINVVLKRDISNDVNFSDKIKENTYFDIVTPYGYGGWIVESKKSDCSDKSQLMEEFVSWCVSNSIISEFVRFHPVLMNHIGLDLYYDIIPLGNTIFMDLSSPEIIWQNITSKNRNVIRKAKNNGIKIYRAQNPDIYKEFKLIYDMTMKKDNADNYYFFNSDFYDSVCNDLKYNSQVFYACAENGDIAAASIIIGANGYLNYHLSGSRREYQHLAPSNLLLYEAALWGYENGYKSFHLGGGVGSKDDSLFSFKKAFNRCEPLRFHIGKKIFDTDKYNELVLMRDNIENHSFFPEYRG